MAMVDVLTSIIINVPQQRVVQYATNPENAPEWYVNIKKAEWKTQPPLRTGSQIDFVAHFMGKEMRYTYEVVELTPAKMVMRTAQGPFPMETTYSFEAVNESATKMYLRNRGNPSGFASLFSFIMEWMMRRANREDLESIKRILENA